MGRSGGENHNPVACFKAKHSACCRCRTSLISTPERFAGRAGPFGVSKGLSEEFARLLEPNRVSPAQHRRGYIHLHQLRAWPETLGQIPASMGLYFSFFRVGRHISLLFRCLIRSDRTGLRIPRDDGGLCLIDTLRAFGVGFLHGVWRFLGLFWAIGYLSEPVFGLRLAFPFPRCSPVLFALLTGLCK